MDQIQKKLDEIMTNTQKNKQDEPRDEQDN